MIFVFLRKVICCLIVLGVISFVGASKAETAGSFPTWAFPMPAPEPATNAQPDTDLSTIVRVPGSSVRLSIGEIRTRSTVPDWFPEGHPGMPVFMLKNPDRENYACA